MNNFLLGVNFWPSKNNIKMWKNWDEKGIEDDINKVKNLGINFLRVFILDEDFIDVYGKINNISIKHLKFFLDLCSKNNLMVMPTLIVGHMSGRNWFIPWAVNNNVYDNASIIKFKNFVREIVLKFRDNKAIYGWIMSNELSIVNRPELREEALLLEYTFYNTVKSIDNKHIASSGDVMSYLQEPVNIDGYSDYSGLHIYTYDNDIVRHRYLYGSLLNIYSNDNDIKIMLEEFGFSSDQFSEESIAGFTYSTLYTALANGAIGAFEWCFSDFKNYDDPPYDWRPLELHFGLIDDKGDAKLTGKYFKKFSDELDILENNGLNKEFLHIPEESCVIVPFFAYNDYTSVSDNYKNIFFNNIPNSITTSLQLAKMSYIPVSAFYENDLDKHIKNKKLIIIPSLPVLRATTWRKLLNYTKNCTIFASTLRGLSGEIKINSYHDSFTQLWSELFGVKNVLYAGEKGIMYKNNININFVSDLGDIKKGETITLPLENNTIFSYRIDAINAKVIARDDYDNPVITLFNNSVLSTVPVELILSLCHNIDWHGGYNRIYEALASLSGIKIYYKSSDPVIEISTYNGNNSDIILCINHSSKKIVSKIINVYKKYSEFTKIAGNSDIINNYNSCIYVEFPPEGVITIMIK